MTELLMICTIIIIYTTNSNMIPFFIILFFAPLIGGSVAGKVANKSKKILFKETFNKYFIILNIILYVLIYLFNYVFNIYMFSIYGLGAILGTINAKRIINKNKLKAQKNSEDDLKSEENLSIKKYKMEKFDSQNIKKFLKSNNLYDDNYIIAQMIPTAKECMIYGIFYFTKYLQYIIHFDKEKLYFFELAKLSNKSIENGFIVYYKDIKIKKVKSRLWRYIIIIEFDNGNKVKLQIVKKMLNFYAQEQYSKKLFEILEEKIKDEKEKMKNK